MVSLPTVDQCDFGTYATDAEKFVGKCKQFPDLKTRPYADKIDALDAIITITRDHLRKLHAAQPIRPGGGRR